MRKGHTIRITKELKSEDAGNGARAMMKMKKRQFNGLVFDGKGRLRQTWFDPPPLLFLPTMLCYNDVDGNTSRLYSFSSSSSYQQSGLTELQ